MIVNVPAAVIETQVADDVVIFVVIVRPAFITNPPPAVPPVATFVIRAHVKSTFMAIDVLPLATRMSVGDKFAQVRKDPDPFAALFH